MCDFIIKIKETADINIKGQFYGYENMKFEDILDTMASRVGNITFSFIGITMSSDAYREVQKVVKDEPFIKKRILIL